MYARAIRHRNTAHARRFGWSRLAAPRPRRPVPRWRRAVRNVVLGAVVLALLFTIFTIRAVGATPPQAPQVVVVRPGQTVWVIAETHFPNQDPRQVVDEIEQANHLRGGEVYPGEHLRLPTS